ncbi:unnamed protein product [Cylindrotheca closterium]|uniref:Dienelactone hydrolase domain-containing protein n=1 Tax=Cylindrotheca closterium TaxID=2856 RepID=A0AAD2GCR9_9STRA|nr:unnamed protein product [Cylindrotheca closterium]
MSKPDDFSPLEAIEFIFVNDKHHPEPVYKNRFGNTLELQAVRPDSELLPALRKIVADTLIAPYATEAKDAQIIHQLVDIAPLTVLNTQTDSSWEAAGEFVLTAIGVEPPMSAQPDMITTTPVEYMDNMTNLTGHLAMPSAEWMRPLPAVIILPDWDGVNTYEQERATALAELGYVAMAADMFGSDKQFPTASLRLENSELILLCL